MNFAERTAASAGRQETWKEEQKLTRSLRARGCPGNMRGVNFEKGVPRVVGGLTALPPYRRNRIAGRENGGRGGSRKKKNRSEFKKLNEGVGGHGKARVR